MTELYIALQRILPQILLGRGVHWLARLRIPWLKDLLIRGFVRLYGVDTDEAEHPVPAGYASFNDFFTRRLQPGARPQDSDKAATTSPADGRVQQAGAIEGNQLIQAKGLSYSVAELLGEPSAEATYQDGWFISIYLAPSNYHRFHAPLRGTLRTLYYVPGQRFAVNETTAGALPGLFARNERLVCHFESPAGPYAMVLVGALNVASISTSWAGEVLPREPREACRWHYPGRAGIELERGDEVGHFNLGSTVILLLPPGAVIAEAGLTPGTALRVGQRIASPA